MAGVFGLEEGLRLIAARGRLMQALPAGGAMVAVAAGEGRVQTALAPFAGEVAIAALNAPESVVLSGRGEAVQAVVEELTRAGIHSQALAVSHAFHSPLMEPLLIEFERVADTVRYSPPRLMLISNLTGGAIGEEIASAEYWCRQVRQPVRFAAGMEALHRQGMEVFIELGPQPVLLGLGRQCLPEGYGTWLPSLRPERDWGQLLESLGALYVPGAPID